jgi:hypothetical protein
MLKWRRPVKIFGRKMYRPRGRLAAVAFQFDEDDDEMIVIGGDAEEAKETAASSTKK